MIDVVLGAAGQPWVYAMVLVVCLVDGFFPPVPSETILVGLAALVVAQGGPNPWLLLLSAALGAFAGDNVAYLMGRGVGTTRFRWMRGALMQRSFAWARRELGQRAVSLILVARFIPVGRVAVNLTAGATVYPRAGFVAISGLSAGMWAVYMVGTGVVAGTWFRENPLLGVVAAVAVSAGLGFLVDKAARWLRVRKQRPGTAPSRAVGQNRVPVPTAAREPATAVGRGQSSTPHPRQAAASTIRG
ncbi:MAG: VTT domain-containing protein [Specibacter sp.]